MINGKLHTDEHVSSTDDLLNPFVHRLELSTTYDKIKTGVLTVAVLPLRVAAIMVLLILAWLLACVGLLGLSEEDLQAAPITGWRRKLMPLICFLGRASYRAGGMSLVIEGKQASRSEAPILVVAPHSTFLDASITYVTGFPSIIVRRESGLNPFIGKLINYTQPVYVWREDPNSRQNTIKEIIGRATSPLDWPQVLIFPEGTCTNRSCLITFKPGAFYPGVPVQPVCLRYPNKLDTVTWTWEGPGALKLLWLTLTQVHSSCVIEFLPVYHPNEAEKKDPKLYANNVRKVMAKALGIPVSDYTYDDCRLMTRAKRLHLPCATGLLELQKLRGRLGFASSNIEQRILLEMPQFFTQEGGKVSYKQFAQLLEKESGDSYLQQLFNLYDKDSSGIIDFRQYVFETFVIAKARRVSDVVQFAFQVYGAGQGETITPRDLASILQQTLGLSSVDELSLCQALQVDNNSRISLEQFQSLVEHRSEFANLFNSVQWSVKNGVSKDCLLKTG